MTDHLSSIFEHPNRSIKTMLKNPQKSSFHGFDNSKKQWENSNNYSVQWQGIRQHLNES